MYSIINIYAELRYFENYATFVIILCQIIIYVVTKILIFNVDGNVEVPILWKYL